MICFSCGEDSERIISDYCPACNRERLRGLSGLREMYAELLAMAEPDAFPEAGAVIDSYVDHELAAGAL